MIPYKLLFILLLLVNHSCSQSYNSIESFPESTSNDKQLRNNYVDNQYISQHHSSSTNSDTLTAKFTGGVVNSRLTLKLSASPYIIGENILIEKNGDLIIEPGVELRFNHRKSVTVYGSIQAKGTEDQKIIFTRNEKNPDYSYSSYQSQNSSVISSLSSVAWPDVRLVDGDLPSEGRVQIKYSGRWHSVCTNSKNWTLSDIQVVCRELGFNGGHWYSWLPRHNDSRQLMFEYPGCTGSESSLLDCPNWVRGRRIGSGICDYHADIGIRCNRQLYSPPSSPLIPAYWSGLRFIRSSSRSTLLFNDRVRREISRSILENVIITYAGEDIDGEPVAAIYSVGVPPQLNRVEVKWSAATGLNISDPIDGISIVDSSFSDNRGYGIFINSSFGSVTLKGLRVRNNGADGIRYITHESIGDGQSFSESTELDGSQVYPLILTHGQSKESRVENPACRYFEIPTDLKSRGIQLTAHFPYLMSESYWGDVRDYHLSRDGYIEVYEGYTRTVISRFQIRNSTRPPSFTSREGKLRICYVPAVLKRLTFSMIVVADMGRAYDLNVTDCNIQNNNGRGIWVENQRAGTVVNRTQVSGHDYVAGINIASGTGDVIINQTTIVDNIGDGVNVTLAGGYKHIDRSTISRNSLRGAAFWFNESSHYLIVPNENHVSYSVIADNLEGGLLMGNVCLAESFWNISMNSFDANLGDAIVYQSCWDPDYGRRDEILITNNRFTRGARLAINIAPAFHFRASLIAHNYFEGHAKGVLYINNWNYVYDDYRYRDVEAVIDIRENHFIRNRGPFVVNIGLQESNERQKLNFERNILKDNVIREMFDRLNPRSRVAAVVVISSSNCKVNLNNLINPESTYELGSHLEHHAKTIDATRNYFGQMRGEYPSRQIYKRIFDRKNRYNMAMIKFLRYRTSENIFDNEDYLSSDKEKERDKYSPFIEGNIIGGEMAAEILQLESKTYRVSEDILVKPGSRLIITEDTVLSFDQSIGMMIQGHVEFKSQTMNRIKFTSSGTFGSSSQPTITSSVNQVWKSPSIPSKVNSTIPVTGDRFKAIGNRSARATTSGFGSTSGRVRLSRGDYGLLEVQMDNGRWGSVCSYGFDIVDASVVCQQLGLVVNSRDWLLEKNQFTSSSNLESSVVLSNVQCTPLDNDILRCKAENRTRGDFDNSCLSEVGIKCYRPSWSGVRFGMSADQTEIKHIEIEKAGLFDYASNSFRPALQIDFNRHRLFNVKITENNDAGIGIMWNDFFNTRESLEISNSEIRKNAFHGIISHSQGLVLVNSHIQENAGSAYHYEPMVNKWEQMDLKSWIAPRDPKSIKTLPEDGVNLTLDPSQSDHLYVKITSKPASLSKFSFNIKTRETYAIGIMVLNPIFEGFTDRLTMYNKNNPKAPEYDLKANLSSFPFWIYSFEVSFDYDAGHTPKGDIILYFVTKKITFEDYLDLDLTEQQEEKNRKIKTTIIKGNLFQGNRHGFSASHYNRNIGTNGDFFYRHCNETFILNTNSFINNTKESLLIDAPLYDPGLSALAEINYTLINNKFIGNSKGIYQESRNYRGSNNLYHWTVNGSIFENNANGGVILYLPYVWQYNENFTHSISVHNNSFRRNTNFEFTIDGHFARFNMSRNIFQDNKCKDGLFTITGMEKAMLIEDNDIVQNSGRYMVEFNVESHADMFGIVQAYFRRNRILENSDESRLTGIRRDHHNPASYSMALRGVQYINITRNLIRNDALLFEFIAGVLTGSLQNRINVVENWWGTANSTRIKERIFDFDDWNSYAIANFSPMLTTESIDAALVNADLREAFMDLDRPFGGRIHSSLTLTKRDKPYIINADLTVLPGANLTIQPGVVLEFYPSVGILVLGDLVAYGTREDWITMRPYSSHYNGIELKDGLEIDVIREKRSISMARISDLSEVRLCHTEACEEWKQGNRHDGFLEIFNRTTMQWIPICDERFSERNAQVVCSSLGYSRLNVHLRRGPRIDMSPTYTSRVRYWPHPLQCSGKESKITECEIRLNGYTNETQGCHHDGKSFVYIFCGPLEKEKEDKYWGGLRFAIPDFEKPTDASFQLPTRSHQEPRSRLQYVEILGAGILHGERNAAIQIIQRDVGLEFVTVRNSAYHGIEAIAPEKHLIFHNLDLTNNLGSGLNYLLLNGASTDMPFLPYIPLKESTLPYNVFSFVDICDTNKNLVIDQRLILYFKYDSRAVDCVKIIRSSVKSKKVGFRLLQFNLFNSSSYSATTDFIRVYDGDIFNQTTKLIAEMGVSNEHRRQASELQYYKSSEDSLSVRIHASGASGIYGFVAEITTSPISYFIGRGLFHNVTNSQIYNNSLGGMIYKSVGETSPSVSILRSSFESNCLSIFGNFTTCPSAIFLHLQNTPHFYFQNNLIKNNDGGLRIRVNAQNAAAALHAYIVNNLFIDNHKREALYIRGPDSGSYQIVIIRRNYFNHNLSPHKNNIYLSKILFNFTENVMVRNYGRHQLAVVGFDISYSHQTIYRNWFYNNFASHWEEKSTIFATNSGQRYDYNYLVNPDNNFEIATMNQSLPDLSKALVDASFNWWGFNETAAVAGRIRDANDYRELLSVRFAPYLTSNASVLSGICSGGWTKIGDTCFLYFGARLTHSEAKHFCELQNSTMPVVKAHFEELTNYLYESEETYHRRFYPVWVQSLGFLEKGCTILLDGKIQSYQCNERLPFLCERAPTIGITLFWLDGSPFGLAIISISLVTAILTFLCLLCWTCKSRERHKEKLERHNSIRASIRSNRSFSSSASLSEIAYKRQIEKAIIMARENQESMGSGAIMRAGATAIGASSFKGITNPNNISNNDSYDSLAKDNSHFVGSDTSDEVEYNRVGQPSRQVFRELEDRFSKDPQLENANVDYLLRPTFDFTIQNEGFKETPSISRASADISKDYPYNTGDSSPVNTLSTMDTKRTEDDDDDEDDHTDQHSDSSSPSLSYPRGHSSPHHYEEYKGKSPTPSSTLPVTKGQYNHHPNLLNNIYPSQSHHSDSQIINNSSPFTNSYNHHDSTSSFNVHGRSGTIPSLSDRPYLETCLDTDNNYDYFQFSSTNRYSPTASVTTASTNRSRPPLETAM
ncbi:protein bark beetle-like [Tetranychus urticae]|uniref:protein bark beetle-like n=1 Tax=Tetranychus urticae TaxID=32264 RepID=UPI00077BEB14|nr:protein bark beetle-like [Tetranychus urticae]